MSRTNLLLSLFWIQGHLTEEANGGVRANLYIIVAKRRS